jgi:RHS repeat-associated protein
VTYPNGTLTVQNNYTPRGYLKSVQQVGGAGTIYWTATVVDAEGRVTLQTLGNGLSTLQAFNASTGRLTTIQTGPTGNGSAVQNLSYTWDALGNLSLRQDLNAIVGGLNESFTYDNLDRLATTAFNNGVPGKTYGYDCMGNITSMPGVGTYSYGSATVPCPTGGMEGRPHAVSAITGTVNGIANPTFVYDANGNLTSGAGRTIAYTSFNLPSVITMGTSVLAWSYDSEHARIKEVKADGSATIYLNPRIDAGIHVERQLTPSGTLDHWENTIYAGGRAVAIQFDYGTGTSLIRYLHKDHLGSTQTLTDETGAVPQNPLQQFSYDPFGRRRLLTGYDDPSAVPSPLDANSATHHGFTGHEHLAEVGLIHMNGRIFDPLIGRFMMADPVIGDALDSQAYNRYSYLKNNPLRDTDPSGYCGFFSCIAKFFSHIVKEVVKVVEKTVVNLVKHPEQLVVLAVVAAVTWGVGAAFEAAALEAAAGTSDGVFVGEFAGAGINIGGASASLTPLGQVVAAGSGGFAGGLVGSGGDLKSALVSGATAAAFAEVGTLTNGHGAGPGYFGTAEHFENIAGHAAVGCVSSLASGRGCGSAALAAGVGAVGAPFAGGLGPVGGLVASATIGGTASVAAGGKFANGAITASFGYLFNACRLGPHGCFGIFTGLGIAAGGAVSGGCDVLTGGVCVAANPAMIGASINGFAAIGVALDNLFNGPVLNAPSSPYGPDGRFTPDAGALVDLAKEAGKRGGVTPDQADTLVGWGKEYGFGDRARGPEDHGTAAGEHIHIGPVDHIPVNR